MWLDRLKQMKAASGLTTREIAVQSNLPEPTLEKIFSGATKDPKLSTVQQLTHFLGYTLDDLYLDSDFPVRKRNAQVEFQQYSPDETALIDNYRKLTAQGRDYIRQTMALALVSYSVDGKNNAASDVGAAQ